MHHRNPARFIIINSKPPVSASECMILDDSVQGNSVCHSGGRTVTERQLSN